MTNHSETDRVLSLAAAKAPWVLIVVGVVVYANSLNGPFMWDDQAYIVENESIRQLWPPAWAEHALGNRPTAAFTLALNYAIGGLNVVGYHAVNVAIHLLCALTALAVLRHTLTQHRGTDPGEVSGAGLALAIALLWMVHPLTSECVNYITQRTESLMALFFLLTLYCALCGFDSGSRAWYAGAVLCCALGMASKESMAAAPLVVLLYDRTFSAGSFGRALRLRYQLYGGLVLTWLVLIRGLWTRPHGDTIGLDLRIDAWTYALNQCQMLWAYLRRVVWPHPLILDYGFARQLALVDVWLEGVAIVALLGLTAVALRRWPPWGFSGAWFFLILAPTSSFVPILTEGGAERRMYLPLLGPVALATVASWRALSRGGRRRGEPVHLATRAGAALVLATALALSWTTAERNRDYRSATAIWRTVVEAEPLSGRGHNNLGSALEKEGAVEEALRHYRRAVDINPGYAAAHKNLGALLGLTGDIDAAVYHLRKAVEIQPRFAEAHHNLALALRLQGDDDRAFAHLRQALDIDPDLAQAHYNLANLLSARQRYDEAVSHYRRALQLKPDYGKARQNLETVLELRQQR